MRNLRICVVYTLFTYAAKTMQFHKGPGGVVYVDVNESYCVNNQGHYKTICFENIFFHTKLKRNFLNTLKNILQLSVFAKHLIIINKNYHYSEAN